MRIEISDPGAFYEVAYPAYYRLRQESGDEPAVLDLAFAPGQYTRLALNLSDAGGGRPVRLVLRAADPANPPVFSGHSIHLASDAIELAHLIVRDTVLGMSVLDLRVQSTLVVRGCAFIGNGSSANPGCELFSFGAQTARATAEIRDCWFIRNRTLHQNPLLALNALPPSRFARVRLDHVAFLDNALTFVIVPYATQALDISRCVLSPAAEAAEPPVLAAINSTDTTLMVDRSLLIGHSLPTLVTRWSSTQPSPAAFPAVRFARSAVFVEDDEPMPNSIFEDTTIQPAARLSRGALAQGVTRALQRAEANLPPDLDQLQAALTAT